MKKLLSLSFMALLIAVMTACGGAEEKVSDKPEETEETETDTNATGDVETEVEVAEEEGEALTLFRVEVFSYEWQLMN